MKPATIQQNLRRLVELDLDIDNLIHVGANVGQEVVEYEAAGYKGYHIEAMPKAFAELANLCKTNPGQTPVQACCDTEAGKTVEFHVASNSQSSSLLPFGRHAVTYKNIKMVETIKVETTTLDALVEEKKLPPDPSLLLLDVQGAEARVLGGATQLLQAPSLWGVISEVSLDPLYEGGATFDTLYVDILRPAEFYPQFANFNRAGWTNAVFLKRWWRVEGEDRSPLEKIANAQASDL